MNRTKTIFLLLCMMAAGITFLSLMPQRTLALSNGGGGYSVPETGGSSCGGCHGAGVAPTVNLTGPNGLSAGQTGSYQLTIQSNDIANQTHAGLNVVVYDSGMNKVGTFIATEAGTQVQFGDLTHLGARANDASGVSTYIFDWTAPSSTTSETYTMYYSGNSVDLNGNPGGDQFAAGSMDITVSIPSAIQLSETAVSTASLWVLPLLAVLSLSILTVWIKRPARSTTS